MWAQASSLITKEVIFSFMLYPAHCRLDTGNLMLRHSVLHFPPTAVDIGYWVVEFTSTPRFPWTSKRRTGNSKYLISWNEIEPTAYCVYIHTAPAPRLTSKELSLQSKLNYFYSQIDLYYSILLY